FLPQSHDELAGQWNVANRLDPLARKQCRLRDGALFVADRTGTRVTAFCGAGGGVRGEDVTLAGAFARRPAARSLPHLPLSITERAMWRIRPSVMKANCQPRVSGFRPSARGLVLVVRQSLLRRNEARADEHAGCPSHERAPNLHAVGDATRSQDGHG